MAIAVNTRILTVKGQALASLRERYQHLPHYHVRIEQLRNGQLFFMARDEQGKDRTLHASDMQTVWAYADTCFHPSDEYYHAYLTEHAVFTFTEEARTYFQDDLARAILLGRVSAHP